MERLIFQSLATNLGTTFKAPTNLGTPKVEDSQLIYLKAAFLDIAQSHMKQVSVHIIENLNLTKCFTSVFIVIMRAIESIILGDM